jgi:hypothetical protein
MQEFKPEIYIDFDKTISPIHGFDVPPKPEVKIALDKLATKFKIVIFSCRLNPDICNKSEASAVIEYLNRYEIPFHETYHRKPLYFAIIDDRAFNPLKDSWEDITNQLMK